MQSHLAAPVIVLAIVSYLIPASLAADQDRPRAFSKHPPRVSCKDKQEDLLKKNAPYVKRGDTYIFAGYAQVSGKNQNPVIVRFDRGGFAWCRKDYETSSDDGRAYGLYFDGANFYAAFSVSGTQGAKSRDFRRFTRRGWLRSYGKGGGPKSAVILQLSPKDGRPLSGTYVNSILKNGKSNSFVITDMIFSGRGLEVQADAWFSPRKPDRTGMTCKGKSPFKATLLFNEDLTKLLESGARGCL